jgi:hypothetical protein
MMGTQQAAHLNKISFINGATLSPSAINTPEDDGDDDVDAYEALME